MSNLLSSSFWFKLRPGILLPASQKIFIGLLIALAVISIILFFVKKKNKKNLYTHFWESAYSFAIINFSIGLLLWFFNNETIPFLSARFWFLFWGVEMAVWAIFMIKNLTGIPKIREQIEKNKEFKKYIP